MAKKKRIYIAYIIRPKSTCIGVQAVKADNKAEGKRKLCKRWEGLKVISIDLACDKTDSIILDHAI